LELAFIGVFFIRIEAPFPVSKKEQYPTFVQRVQGRTGAFKEPLRNNMAISSISLRLLIPLKGVLKRVPLKGVLKRVPFRAFLWPCYFFTTAYDFFVSSHGRK
jgi:hypothetical protein